MLAKIRGHVADAQPSRTPRFRDRWQRRQQAREVRAERPMLGSDRLGRDPVEAVQRQQQIAPDFGRVRRKRERAPERRDRRLGIAEILEHVAEVRMRPRVLRVELERAPVGGHRFGGAAQLAIQVAEIVVHRRGPRIEGERLLVVRQRRLRIAGVEQRAAEIDFGVEELRIERHRALQAVRWRPRAGHSAGRRPPADCARSPRRDARAAARSAARSATSGRPAVSASIAYRHSASW